MEKVMRKKVIMKKINIGAGDDGYRTKAVFT